MTTVLALAAAGLLLAMLLGMVRVLAGPDLGDRMMAVQLLGTTGVGLLLVLAPLLSLPALRDVALVLALLAAVSVVAFTRRTASPPEVTGREEDS